MAVLVLQLTTYCVSNNVFFRCLQYEESEKQLVMKEQKLRSEIAEAKKKYQELLKELGSLDVKEENS